MMDNIAEAEMVEWTAKQVLITSANAILKLHEQLKCMKEKEMQ